MFRKLRPKILIIESQIIIAVDVLLQCSKLGCKVIGVISRTEDVLKTIEADRPDIVLMDIGMNEKTNALAAARVLLGSFRIPVILMSAYTDKATFVQIIDVNPYAFITKPFEKEDLQRGIETALFRMAAEGLIS